MQLGEGRVGLLDELVVPVARRGERVFVAGQRAIEPPLPARTAAHRRAEVQLARHEALERFLRVFELGERGHARLDERPPEEPDVQDGDDRADDGDEGRERSAGRRRPLGRGSKARTSAAVGAGDRFGTRRPGGAAYARAVFTRAVKRRRAGSEWETSSSGCHCTPRTKRERSDSSRPSTIWSGAHATAPEPRAERLDRLVVHAIDLDLVGAEGLGEPAARLDHDLVGGLVARRLLAVRELGAGIGADVLVETAAERDVQHLDAAADREDRQPPIERDPHRRGLDGVARRRDVVERGMRGLAEERGVHVAAAGQEQAVQAPREPIEGGGAELGRQRHRYAPGLLDGVEVRRVHVGPLGMLVDSDRGADADEGTWRHGASITCALRPCARIRRMSLDSAQNQRAAASDGGSMTQVMGRHWMIAAGHPLAAQAGARVLAAGGNAIDAGVAAGMTLGVVHPDMVSFAGVAPILVHLGKTGETFEVSGVGPYPQKATADFYRTRCGGEIPSGVLRTVVPAAPDAWCTALERWGTLSFADAVAPALECAAQGFPLSRFSAAMTRANVERYRRLADLGRAVPARRPGARPGPPARSVGAGRDHHADDRGREEGAPPRPRPGDPRRARRVLQGRDRPAHRRVPRARGRAPRGPGPRRVPGRRRPRAPRVLPRLRGRGVRLLVSGAGAAADAEPHRAL